MKQHYSLILRGHIRSSFENKRLLKFTKSFLQYYPNSDVFICTWNYTECKKNTSWKKYNIWTPIKETDKYIITERKIKKYFNGIECKKIIILDEYTFYERNKHISFSETIGETIVPILVI